LNPVKVTDYKHKGGTTLTRLSIRFFDILRQTKKNPFVLVILKKLPNYPIYTNTHEKEKLRKEKVHNTPVHFKTLAY
jgi:hypothetical protein